ncbi:AMP-binding protein [Novosphingobium album (ex Hu et al. 2023)]|uniref:AMP-binding protein n=1 Tax=Novosphingobium album (ex Hu et al. 2023) TaxID=2930093 RepID=A0ABT0B7R8_9SPHN|nr:AMP-binding protein [Novosphingobium album (ex Hu et al. 2023)]MCJ2181048.1 AMP-binding protein [Novosphingobium album (ex Hu et al. 2023)]
MTIFHDLLRSSAATHGGRIALLFGEEQLSYEDVLVRAEGLAVKLTSEGIGPDDHLAVVMDNSLECVLVWLASSIIGCTEVPVNPQYRGTLLHYMLADAQVTAAVCDACYLPGILDVAAQLPDLKRVLVNGHDAGSGSFPVTIRSLDVSATPEQFVGVESAPERIILYTSGTTGPSKGVVHTQRSMLVLSRYNAEVMGYGEHDRLLNFFPLFHQNARYTGVIPALCSGASIRIERKLSTSTFWQTCDRDRITAFNYLGSVLRMILNVTGPERHTGMHSVKKAFGAGASPGVWAEFEDRLGIALYETYGLSEAPMATLNLPENRSPRGSAGRASALFDVAVVDEDDELRPAGEMGEIVLRPRRADALMAGYHNNDAATAHALRGGWFHSGDRGFLNAAGDLYFEERAKDSIRRRGENISAWEVESVLEQHPAVAEAAVCGVACDDREEEVAASLIPSDANASLADIVAFARQRLPAYAVPTLMRLVPDLPRTPTAKVRKEELRAVPRASYCALPAACKQEGLLE